MAGLDPATQGRCAAFQLRFEARRLEAAMSARWPWVAGSSPAMTNGAVRAWTV